MEPKIILENDLQVAHFFLQILLETFLSSSLRTHTAYNTHLLHPTSMLLYLAKDWRPTFGTATHNAYLPLCLAQLPVAEAERAAMRRASTFHGHVGQGCVFVVKLF